MVGLRERVFFVTNVNSVRPRYVGRHDASISHVERLQKKKKRSDFNSTSMKISDYRFSSFIDTRCSLFIFFVRRFASLLYSPLINKL